MNFKFAFAVIGVLLFTSGVFGQTQVKPSEVNLAPSQAIKPAPAPPAPPAPPAEAPKAEPVPPPKPASIDPPQAWKDQLKKFMALDKTLAKLKEDEGIDTIERSWEQMRVGLLNQVPRGYQYNPKTEKFELLPTPAAAPPSSESQPPADKSGHPVR